MSGTHFVDQISPNTANAGVLITANANGTAVPAGNVGTVLSISVPIGSEQSLSSGVIKNLGNFTLGAGIWQIAGTVTLDPNNTTAFTKADWAMSTANNTIPTNFTVPDSSGQIKISTQLNTTAANSETIALPFTSYTVALTSSQTLYANVSIVFTVSGCAAFCYIEARRVS